MSLPPVFGSLNGFMSFDYKWRNCSGVICVSDSCTVKLRPWNILYILSTNYFSSHTICVTALTCLLHFFTCADLLFSPYYQFASYIISLFKLCFIVWTPSVSNLQMDGEITFQLETDNTMLCSFIYYKFPFHLKPQPPKNMIMLLNFKQNRNHAWELIKVDVYFFIQYARWLSDSARVLGRSFGWDPEVCMDCMTLNVSLNQSRIKSTCCAALGSFIELVRLQ